MSAGFALQPLLPVQKQRVDKAMAEVRLRLQVLHLKEAERNTVYEHWAEADALCRREHQSYSQGIADHLGEGFSATGLTAGSAHREGCRMRVEECWKALEAAEAELGRARAAAAEAQLAYRRAHARQDALLKLADQARREQLQKEALAEDAAIEDLTASRFG